MTRKKIKRPTLVGLIQPGYRNLIIGFAVLALILVIIILYFALAQATIYITPRYQRQKVGFAVQVVDKNTGGANNITAGRIIGATEETTVEATEQFPATNYQITENKAGGEITIINNYNKNQPLVATTRFLTPDGKLYRLEKGVTVPANGKITAIVSADQEGAEYEIGSTKLTIPGLWEGLRDKIYAETSGLNRQLRTKYAVTQKNIDEAANNLKLKLIDQAKEKLQQNLEPKPTLSSNDLIAEIIKYSVSEKAESPAANFTISMTLGVTAIIFDQGELKRISYQNLPDIYKQSGVMVKIEPDSFNYAITLLDKNSEDLIAQIKGEYGISVSTTQIDKAAIASLNKNEAEKHIMSLGNIEKVEIKLPFWTNYLPALADNINIIINNQ